MITAAPAMDRVTQRFPALHRLAQWFSARPWAIAVLLGLAGIAIRHAWISVYPLSAGDWHWPDNQRVTPWAPWPTIWDSTLGLGGENRFLDAFRFPVYAVLGGLASLGLTWTVLEKAIYFVPFAVLLPVGGWLLAREVVGRTRWALLTPLLLVGASYFLLEADGEVPLALAEALSLFVLIAFLRTIRRNSLGWAAVTGLLLTLVAAYDVRPAYLVLVVMAMYFVLLALAERDWHALLRRTLLGAVAGAVFAGTQAFWLVPFLTYKGNPGLPIPQAPNFNVLTLGHGIAGIDAFWTGGVPAQLVQAPLNPAFMLLPLIAMAPLLARRVRLEVIWLASAALLFAFFTKTDNPPLGSLYDWMYIHVPGWKLFREGSKFIYVVTVAYSLLVPIALSSAFAALRGRRPSLSRTTMRAGLIAALVGVIAVAVWPIGVLQTGSLQSTTQPTPEPASFSTFSSVIADDPRPGPVLWFGQPLITDGVRNHHFLIASPTHPAFNATGNFASAHINSRDLFQLFCTNNQIPYCYVDSQLFPYLMSTAGVSYVVVPGGEAVGSLPRGVTRAWLRQQITDFYGPAEVLGSGPTALWVWRMPSPAPAVTTALAVALVQSGTWATKAALPALQALGVPTAYRESFDASQYPVAPDDLPDSVAVLPRLDQSCLGDTPTTAAVMAESSAASLGVTVGGVQETLPLLTAAQRLPGWSLYGPVALGAGETRIIGTGSSAPALGPCIGWSPLAVAALGGHVSSVQSITPGSSGEQLTVATSGHNGAWVELSRYFDPGWRLDGSKPLTLGDGLFNLYHLKPAQLTRQTLTLAYSTLPMERIGEGVALITLVAAIALAVWDFRRRRAGVKVVERIAPSFTTAPRAARWVATVGYALLGVTALAVILEWFGVPSLLPLTATASDPYATDVGYGGIAIALLLLSLAVRVVAGTLARRGADQPAEPETRRRPMTRAAAAVGLTVLLVSCGSPGDLQNLITEAQNAGAVAPTILGSSLDDARLERASRDPGLCIADYTEALKDFPTLVAAFVGRGDCYLNGGQDAAAAVHDYSAAISLSPLQPDLYLHRAVGYRVIGNLQAAAADYERAALIPDANAGEQLTAVDGLIAIGDYSDASTVYARALQLDPQTALLHVAGSDLDIATGNPQGAAAELTAATQLARTKSDVAVILGHECHNEVLTHDFGHAATSCAVAAGLTSSGSGAWDDLSAADLALGNLSGALQAINRSISTFVGNVGPYAQEGGVDGFGLANLYDARGWIHIQMNDVRDAVADFNLALSSLPTGAPDLRARIKGYLDTARAD